MCQWVGEWEQIYVCVCVCVCVTVCVQGSWHNDKGNY